MMSAPNSESSPTSGAASRSSAPSPPYSLVLGIAAGLGILYVAIGALRDIDLYWHLLAGSELAVGGSPGELGMTWSFAPSPLPWTSTQWVAERLFHELYVSGGWGALAAYRTLTAAAAVAVVTVTTLRGRPAALAGFPYLIGVIAICAFAQERPQQVSTIGAAVLGGVIVAALTSGRLPRWWLLLPVTIIWANVHGGWILVPVSLLLIAAGRLLDHGVRDRIALRAALLVAATAACGLVSPAGLSNVTAVFRFANATDVILEWLPVTPTQDVGLLTLGLLTIILVAWARPGRVPRGEVLVTLTLLVFAWTAGRNVVVGILMLIPLAAHRLVQAYPTFGRRAEPRWSVPAAVASAVALCVLGLAVIPAQPQLPTEDYPFTLYRKIAEHPEQRVLNDYNLAGMVLFFGGDGVRVGIDGRSDRYGADYIAAYTGMMNLEGDWEELLAELKPTSAIMMEDDALAHVLVTERGWTEVGSENGYVLLRPGPEATELSP